MVQKLPHLIPPFRYAIVEENLFRGGYPKPRNMRFLKRLKLKTILSLIPDKLVPEMQEFCEQQNIHMLHLTIDKMKEDNIPLSYNKTLMALQIIIDPTNHPIYIHCLDGADVTGLVIACLRKLQMWSTSSAMVEFARNLHTNVVAPEEFEFVENFKNFEVTIPITIPNWLWGGQVNFHKHPSLRLKFLNPDMMTEEERELKDLKEKREKQKEDFYKKRKNDLLDNLFEPTMTGNHSGMRHHKSGIASNVSSGPGSSTASHKLSSSIADMDDAGFTLSTSVMADMANGSSEDVKEDLETSPSSERYLVDVDVDVDGVMMDGLDQVEYYNRQSGYFPEDFGRTTRFYADNDGEGVLLVEDEHGDLYDDGSGTRFTGEPISRTLEALALEGLSD
ncbi:tyrosine phosphatase family-domain-containing protein [Radiomyces spectabilis]|uniref:tyrosine phosphatase family-domain-containing protein n=1 Tax=Radiomyces spectabilis TaxID=64574 RepID=UPI00221EB8FE|nr:tyrosine phosphatase family-domain-containing protein [Radiomyces spectabilis]KAI8388070.1 tyrosine phosphatase family-domain-containing protein [Radiomyces spectabilis]